MSENEDKKNILAKPLEITPAMFDGKGVIELVDKLDKDLRSIVLDGSTKEGRAECVSLANNVRKSKAHIDDVGKEIVKPLKDKAKIIDAQRKEVREKLDSLAIHLRKPASDWEAVEAKRIQDHREALQRILALKENIGFLGVTEIHERIHALAQIRQREFEEYKNDADTYVRGIEVALDGALADAKKREDDAKELERLRKLEAERKQNNPAEHHSGAVQQENPTYTPVDPPPVQVVRSGTGISLREQQGMVHKNVANALMNQFGFDDSLAKSVVVAIVKGQIPNVSINY
jgi:hypothetical protein